MILLLIAYVTGAGGLRVLFLTHFIGIVPQVAETLSLIFIAAGYTLEAKESLLEAVFLFEARRNWFASFLITSTVNTTLLVYIVINALSVYNATRKSQARLPVVAFSFMLLSNTVLIPSLLIADEMLFILSKLLHILGLLALMLLAVEVSRA